MELRIGQVWSFGDPIDQKDIIINIEEEWITYDFTKKWDNYKEIQKDECTKDDYFIAIKEEHGTLLSKSEIILFIWK